MNRNQFLAAVAGAGISAAGAMAQDAVQWRVEDGGNGHWYSVVNFASPTLWGDAELLAIDRGARLANLESELENRWVASTFEGVLGLPHGQAWVGGRRVSDVWMWSTNVVISYLPWNCFHCHPSCQPDYPCETDLLVMCVSAGIAWFNNGGSCLGSGETQALLEWSADCNGDGVVDYGQCRDGTLPDFNGNNIPDCCEQGQACVTGSFPLQWRVEDGGNGHWYKRVTVAGELSWSDSNQASMASAGHLVTLTSEAEQAWVQANLIANRPTCSPASWATPRAIWIGLYQDTNSPSYSEPSGGWRWVTDEPFVYSNWSVSEPNNVDSPANFAGAYGDGRWDDTLNDAGVYCYRGYAIEWSADCNGDGVVDYGQILQGQLADTNGNGVPDECELPCLADIDGNGEVNGIDLAIILDKWGTDGGKDYPNADIDGDGTVAGPDLSQVLSGWGPCQ